MRLFLISDDQLTELYDSFLDADLKRFESVLYKVKTDQDIRVDGSKRPIGVEDGEVRG
jgi:hypothetical protein